MMNRIQRLAAALMLMAAPLPAAAQQIDLLLNLSYNDVTDDQSGGEWQLVGSANSESFGIATLTFTLRGIDSAINKDAPRGLVNGSDGAGFSTFVTAINSTGTLFAVGHGAPPAVAGSEVGDFYGFGTRENGSPQFPGIPAGATALENSPTYSTLSDLEGLALPWATGDIFGDEDFDVFAQIASGTFSAGETPEFFNIGSNTSGSVFSTIGTATERGVRSAATVTLLETRTDLLTIPDYNRDTFVDSADYVVFRDTVGLVVENLGDGADGDASGVIDLPDYQAWQAGFGFEPAEVVAAATAVPEPATALIAAIGFLGVNSGRRGRKIDAAEGQSTPLLKKE